MIPSSRANKVDIDSVCTSAPAASFHTNALSTGQKSSPLMSLTDPCLAASYRFRQQIDDDNGPSIWQRAAILVSLSRKFKQVEEFRVRKTTQREIRGIQRQEAALGQGSHLEENISGE